jgi:hypothetical protein
MEISPIAGIGLSRIAKVPPVEAGLSAIFDIENLSKTGDDSYSGNGRKAAGGQDDEDGELEEGGEPESAAPAEENGGGVQVNYFA